ncbi:MAG: TrmB family transcriptional regulator [Candidatus Hodarchaeota archaeon]
MRLEETLVDDFQTLGLSQNESKTLLALVKLGGSGEVSKIEDKTNIKRNKIYQALGGLISKKLVLKGEVKGGANSYRLLHENPTDLISYMQETMINPIDHAAERSAQNLAKITDVIEKTPHEIWMIKGDSDIKRIEREIIDSARDSIVSNLFPEYIDPIIPNLQNAIKKGINIKLLMLEEETAQLKVPLDTICSEHLGINASKLATLGEMIPLDANPILTPILDNLGQFLTIRPNFLFIDSETENSSGLLIIKSTKDTPYSIALQTYNKDFISSFMYLIDFIQSVAMNMRMLQDTFLSDD